MDTSADSATRRRFANLGCLATSRRAVAVGAALLTLIGALLAWCAYQGSRERVLFVTTAEPTLVEVLARGERLRPLVRFTTPAPDGVRLPAGDYDLRLGGRGRVGEVVSVDLDTHADVVQVSASLDHLRHCEPFVESRFLVPVDLGTAQGLVAFTPEGLKLLTFGPPEPAAKEDEGELTTPSPLRIALTTRWTLDLRDPDARALPAGFDWKKTWNWLGDSPEDRELDHYQPRLNDRFVDLDDDGIGDVLCAGVCQAWVLAVSGATGDVLWCAARGADVVDTDVARGLFGPHASSTVLGRPEVIEDVDGDGSVDLLATFLDRRDGSPQPASVERWVEVMSGATGQTLWRFAIPDAWWEWSSEQPERPLVWDYSRSLGGVFYSRMAVSESTELRPSVARRVPWGAQGAVGFIAGSRVALLDLHTGAPLQSEYDLVNGPERGVEWGDFDSDGFADVACRQKLEEESGGKVAEYAVAHSPKRGRRLWKSGELHAGWSSYNLLSLPTEPLVADVTGDGIDDVLVLETARASADDETSVWMLFDGAAGGLVWRRPLRHSSTDAPLGQTLVGPDIDGDGRRELFVATVARDAFYPQVHAISGADGSDLWRATGPTFVSSLPIKQRLSVASVVGVRWRQAGVDGWPQVVVRCQGEDVESKWFSSVTCFSAGTGAVAQAGEAIDGVLVADLDGDGDEELLTFRGGPDESTRGTWEVAQGTTNVRWRRHQDNSWSVIPDVNGDGCQDFLVEPPYEFLRAYDGRTGTRLWTRSYVDDDDDRGPGIPRRDRRIPVPPHSSTFALRRLTADRFYTNGLVKAAAVQDEYHDHDRDGTPDLMRVFVDVRPTYWLVSGRTGRASFLWQRLPESQVEVLGSADLDGDERYEWLVRETNSQGTNLEAWSTSFQRRLWTHGAVEASPGLAVVRCDGDAIPDFVFVESVGETGEITWCAVSGRGGETLWRLKHDRDPVSRASRPDLMMGISFPASDTSPGSMILATRFKREDALAYVFLFACVDSASGHERWRWESDYRNSLGDHREPSSGPLAMRRGGEIGAFVIPVPGLAGSLAIVDAEGKGKWLELPIANPQRDLPIPQAAVVDSDGNGVDELAVLTADQILWYGLDELLSDGPVVPARSLRIPAHQVYQGAYAGAAGAGPLWGLRGANLLTAFAANNGRPRWQVDLPAVKSRPSGDSSRVEIRCLEATATGRTPHVLAAHGQDSLGVRQASRTMHVEPGEKGRASRAASGDVRIVNPAWETWGVDRAAAPPRPGRDERFERPLPWGERDRWRRRLDDSLASRHPLRYLRPIVRRWILSLALVVGPLAFVTRSIRRRQFSLRQLLVAPVLVGAALTFGAWSSDRYDRDAWFDELFRTDDWAESLGWLEPYWSTRWGLAIRYAPPVALTLLVAAWLATGRRRRIGWLAVALAVGVAATALILVALDLHREPFQQGEYYAWREWYLVGWDGVLATSWIVGPYLWWVGSRDCSRGRSATR